MYSAWRFCSSGQSGKVGKLVHHRNAGTHDDPDLVNYQDYPVTKASFKRKIAPDLMGRTGVKILSFIARGLAGGMSNQKRSSAKPFLSAVGRLSVIVA